MFFRKALFFKLAVLLLLVGVVLVPQSSSFFSDVESTDNNKLTSGSLDMELAATPNPLNPLTPLKKGDSVVQEIKVKNIGSLPFQYSAEYVNSAGDTDFCNTLTLKIEKASTTLYSGLLSQLQLLTPNPNLNPTSEDNLTFTISLPSTASDTLSGKSCTFDFKFSAWQAELTSTTTGFSDEETISDNHLAAADFAKPCIPILSSPEDDETITDDTPHFKWGNCTPMDNIQGFYIRIYSGTENGTVWPSDDGYFTKNSQYIADPMDDNHYFWQVRAKGTNGVFGDWTEKWQVTIDTTEPLTTLWAANSPERQIKEDVLNGEFDDGLNNWFHTDDVYVSQKDEKHIADENGIIIDYTVDPHAIPADNPGDNYNMVVIKPMAGNNTKYPAKGDDFYYGMIQQEISNSANTLSFWFNFATMDSAGFDNPGLSVFINNQQIQQIWAQDVNYPPETPYLTGWHKFYYDISSIPNGDDGQKYLSLVFFSGNRQDMLLDSWVYLDKISTNDLVVNASTRIILRAEDKFSSTKTYYKLGTCAGGAEKHEYTFGDNGFSLTKDTASDKFCYWSEDEWGNKEGKKSVNVLYDDDGPTKISNLKAVNFSDGSFGLNWTAPHDASHNTYANTYDIRYATVEPTADDVGWNSMISLIGKMTINAPRAEGAKENYEVPIDAGLEPTLDYWFAVKTQDSAGNWSLISNIAHAEPPEIESMSLSATATPLDTTLDFKLIDDKKAVEFTATGISNWTNLSYTILYNSDQGEQAIVGKLDINGQDSITKTDLVLGSASTLDDKTIYTYHTGITKIKLTMILTGDGIPDRTIEREIDLSNE